MEKDFTPADAIWVNSDGKRFSIDLHKGKDGNCDYLTLTEHSKGVRYRVAIPMPMAPRLIKALNKAYRQASNSPQV